MSRLTNNPLHIKVVEILENTHTEHARTLIEQPTSIKILNNRILFYTFTPTCLLLPRCVHALFHDVCQFRNLLEPLSTKQ